MNQIKRIQIESLNYSPAVWYSNRIGDIFNVTDENEKIYYIESCGNHNCIVYKCDAVVLDSEDFPLDSSKLSQKSTTNSVNHIMGEIPHVVAGVKNETDGYFDSSNIATVLEGETPKALRYNSGKLKWSLVHFKSIEPMVKVLEAGAKKYAPDNWKKSMDKKEILECAQRHLAALIDGEELDPETGESHAGHIMCNCMFYIFHSNKKQ